MNRDLSKPRRNHAFLAVRFVLAVTALSMVTDWACAADHPERPGLLVVEKKQGDLAMVDPETRQILWRVPVGQDPHEVVLSPDGKRAYVSNYGGPGSALHTLSVVDLDSHTTLEPVDISPLNSAHGLMQKDGKIYFTAETNKVIGRYDPSLSKVDWVMGTAQDRTHMLLMTPDHSIVTANAASGSVSIISPVMISFAGSSRPNWTVTTIPTGDGTQGIDLTPDGRFLWVMAAKTGEVAIVDMASKQVTGKVALSWKSGNRLKITPDGRTALIGSEVLIAIDTTTKAVRTLKLGTTVAESILIRPDGAVAYVALPQEKRVAVVDLKRFVVSGYIETGEMPDGMAWVAPH